MNWLEIRKIMSEHKFLREICFCWSWKDYVNCCKKVPHSPYFTQELYNQIFDVSRSAWFIPSSVLIKIFSIVSEKKCLCNLCNQNAINSHLISKSVLENVFSNNEMYTIYFDDDKVFTFKKLGIKQIKTFLWWCNIHDSNIFKDIDWSSFDSENIIHVFLYTLRALWYETRIKQNSLRQAYSSLFYWEDNENLLLIFLWTYNWYFDIKKRYYALETHYINKKFSRVKYKNFKVFKTNSLFISSVFQVSYDLDWKIINDLWKIWWDTTPLVFNVITNDTAINIIFSCLDKDYKIYDLYFSQIENYFNNNYEIFLNIINNIIYYYCENIIIWDKTILPKDFKLASFFETDFYVVDFKLAPKVKFVSLN